MIQVPTCSCIVQVTVLLYSVFDNISSSPLIFISSFSAENKESFIESQTPYPFNSDLS